MDPWAITKRGPDVARALAKQLGLQAETPEEVAKALRTVSAGSILKAAKVITPVCVSHFYPGTARLRDTLPAAVSILKGPKTINRFLCFRMDARRG